MFLQNRFKTNGEQERIQEKSSCLESGFESLIREETWADLILQGVQKGDSGMKYVITSELKHMCGVFLLSVEGSVLFSTLISRIVPSL